MMQLISYELKKIRRRPLTLVVVAGCLLLTLFTVFMGYGNEYAPFYNTDIATGQNQTLYADYEDPALQVARGGKAQTLSRERYAAFASKWDDAYVQQLVKQYNSFINNPQNYTNQIDELNTIMREYQLQESGFTPEEIEEYNLQNPLYEMKRSIEYGEGEKWNKVAWILNSYFTRPDGSVIPVAEAFPHSGGLFPFGYHEGISNAISFQTDIVGIFAALMILAGIAPLFCEEISLNTAPLLLSSKNGRTRLMRAKLTACLIYSALCVLVLSGIVFVLCGLLNGFDGQNLFMQMHNNTTTSPWSLTLGQYFGAALLMQLGAGLVLGMVTGLLSSIFSSAFPTLLSSIVLFGTSLFLLLWLQMSPLHIWAQLLPATALLPIVPIYFTQWRTFSFGPLHIPQWAFTAAVWLITIALCWFLVTRIYKRKEV